jgi:predicted pyridoxine 5'-phosphate oxidase superfamily flavin-nucleotide-binding protein
VAADVYHEGERAAQRLAGLLDEGTVSGRGIRSAIPEVAQRFLVQQPMAVLGAADADGRMWASLLTAPPGFLHADVPGSAASGDVPGSAASGALGKNARHTRNGDRGVDAGTLVIDARPVPGDPLRDRLAAPAPIGMIVIEPARHRRMRMNGRATPTGRGLRVALDQVYSNCPKYIQKRMHRWRPSTPGDPRHSRELTGQQGEFIERADTFFIATADRDGNADASHRGGNPGFVQVLSPSVLRWPDYVGNAMFNTLGNLEVNPSAGLLFPDWRTGTTLQLTGIARTDWDPAHAAAVPGAQRLVEFTVTGVVELPAASPLRWGDPAFSRFNPPVPPRIRSDRKRAAATAVVVVLTEPAVLPFLALLALAASVIVAVGVAVSRSQRAAPAYPTSWWGRDEVSRPRRETVNRRPREARRGGC